jgi:hypothetical protein
MMLTKFSDLLPFSLGDPAVAGRGRGSFVTGLANWTARRAAPACAWCRGGGEPRARGADRS